MRLSSAILILAILSGVPVATADQPSVTRGQVDAWIKAAQDGELDLRIAAIEGLGRASRSAEPAFPLLIQALQDPTPEIRGAAATALGNLAPQPKTALPALAALFDDAERSGNIPVGMIAAFAIAEFGSDCIPYLIEALAQEKPNPRRAAAVAICALGPAAKATLPALVEALKSSDLETRRPALMNALLRLGPVAKPTIPLLLEYLNDEDFHTQYWSCRVLGAIGPDAEPAVPKLIQLARDGVASVRRNAVAALGDIGPIIGDEGLEVLIDAVNEPFQPVRENAVIALGKLGDLARPAIPTLEAALADDSTLDAKSYAARTLWGLEPKSKIPLRILVADLQGDLPAAAVQVLGEIGPEIGAVEPVTELLESPKPYTRLHAAMALGLMVPDSKASLRALEKCLQDEDEEVREIAQQALDAIRVSQD